MKLFLSIWLCALTNKPNQFLLSTQIWNGKIWTSFKFGQRKPTLSYEQFFKKIT